jgi:hypothetical protein
VTAGKLTQCDRVRTGGSFLSSSDMRLHFGLGENSKVDSVEVHWPSGIIDKLANLDPNQILVIQEGREVAAFTLPAVAGNKDELSRAR